VDRSLYRREPGDVPTVAVPVTGVALRRLTDHDDEALARLMERAYAGTIDEPLGGSDGAVEIAGWRRRGAVAHASFVTVGPDDQPIAAALVAEGPPGTAWLSYVITDPDWKGRGLGTAVVAAALAVLPDTAVFAGVTDGNTPWERLLASLGFVRTGPLT
jgi:GNAT superfamily N-acetyltransferase